MKFDVQVLSARLPGAVFQMFLLLGVFLFAPHLHAQPASLSMTKAFTNDPVLPGGTVNLQYTIIYGDAAADATGIAFTDDFNAALTGLAVTGPLPSNPCGAGSALTGTSQLSFTGGSLAPGTFCTFSVTLLVPSTAVGGAYPSTSGSVTATSQGSPISAPGASDTLDVAAFSLTKVFTNSPALAGGTLNLQFTLTNGATSGALSAINFTDDLNAALAGLAVTGTLPSNPCGAGSALSGTTSLSFSGGSLATGASCTFTVTVLVPAGAAPGEYLNTTSTVSGTLPGPVAASAPAATAPFVVGVPLSFGKSFINDPVAPGSPVTLSFTIANLDATQAATGLTFTDDLSAVLPGLAATGLPASDVCGAGSQLAGTTNLTLTGGNLAAGASCTFTVTLQVPGNASPGSHLNTTSSLSGNVGGTAVTSPPAEDSLAVTVVPVFGKSFSPVAISTGGTSTLTFSINNAASALSATNLSFTDNLPTGLVVAPTPNASSSCIGGTLTAAAGTGVISYSGGTVAGNAGTPDVCTIQVDVTAAGAGSYVNTSGSLTSSAGDSGPASATLQVSGLPLFGKSFAPSSITSGGVSALVFTINNSAGILTAGNLTFADSLPAGMVVANPANGSTTCTGGSLTANPGANSISYSGGSLAAGATCQVQVNVTAAGAGSYVNTSGNLSSSLGNSGSATATLTVGPSVVIPTLGWPGLLVMAALLGWLGLGRLRARGSW